jgi:hypothetical protein
MGDGTRIGAGAKSENASSRVKCPQMHHNQECGLQGDELPGHGRSSRPRALTIPSANAVATASARVLTPSFSRIAETW